jgi:hypothetical protein
MKMIWLQWIALAVVLICSGEILLRGRWRWIIGFLAFQYLGTFILIMAEWNVSMASVMLVAGWMASAILGIAHLNREDDPEIQSTSWSQGRLFRLAAIGIVIVVSFIGGIGLSGWLGLPIPAAWGALLLIGMGLFNLGVSSSPFRIIIGLLTALAGFNVIYAAVESSALVAGLQVVITLGLALSGAYFLILPAGGEIE